MKKLNHKMCLVVAFEAKRTFDAFSLVTGNELYLDKKAGLGDFPSNWFIHMYTMRPNFDTLEWVMDERTYKAHDCSIMDVRMELSGWVKSLAHEAPEGTEFAEIGYVVSNSDVGLDTIHKIVLNASKLAPVSQYDEQKLFTVNA